MKVGVQKVPGLPGGEKRMILQLAERYFGYCHRSSICRLSVDCLSVVCNVGVH